MSNEALQALSLKYIRGEISKPEFRQRRRDIINEATGVVNSDAPSEQPAPVIKNNQAPSLLKASVISAIVVGTLIALYATM